MHFGAEKISLKRNPFGSNDSSRWIHTGSPNIRKNLKINFYTVLPNRLYLGNAADFRKYVFPGTIPLAQYVDADAAADVPNLQDQITHSNNISSGLERGPSAYASASIRLATEMDWVARAGLK